MPVPKVRFTFTDGQLNLPQADFYAISSNAIYNNPIPNYPDDWNALIDMIESGYVDPFTDWVDTGGGTGGDGSGGGAGGLGTIDETVNHLLDVSYANITLDFFMSHFGATNYVETIMDTVRATNGGVIPGTDDLYEFVMKSVSPPFPEDLKPSLWPIPNLGTFIEQVNAVIPIANSGSTEINQLDIAGCIVYISLYGYNNWPFYNTFRVISEGVNDPIILANAAAKIISIGCDRADMMIVLDGLACTATEKVKSIAPDLITRIPMVYKRPAGLGGGKDREWGEVFLGGMDRLDASWQISQMGGWNKEFRDLINQSYYIVSPDTASMPDSTYARVASEIF